MKYVLLKLEDDAAEKFVRKAGKKALGVWDVPRVFCGCDDMYQTVPDDWAGDPSGWPKCKQCEGLYKPLVSLGQRLRGALGRNLIRKYRD